MTPHTRLRLRLEFAALFVIAPVLAAAFVPPGSLFALLFAAFGLSLVLLFRTPGFAFRQFLSGRVSWGRIGLMAVLSVAASWALMAWLRPEAGFMPGRRAPGLLVAILLLYPVLSALPQEVVYRVLFFERYGPVLPRGRWGLILNAALFALAHLIYWNWIVAALTFAGGLAFAQSYRDRRSFPEALALHAVAGNILFAMGMGAWFYSGNVTAPF